MFELSVSPLSRRLIQAVSFEALGLIVTALALSAMAGSTAGTSVLLAIVTMEVALLWNIVFNSGFEAWESRQTRRGRSFSRRAMHAVLFEIGLSAMTTPVLALGLGVSIGRAFTFDILLTLIFLIYTYLFTWAFDGLFGLPESAR